MLIKIYTIVHEYSELSTLWKSNFNNFELGISNPSTPNIQSKGREGEQVGI